MICFNHLLHSLKSIAFFFSTSALKKNNEFHFQEMKQQTEKTYSWWFYNWQQFTKRFSNLMSTKHKHHTKTIRKELSSFLTTQGNMPLNVIELSAAGVLNDEKIICPIGWKWKLNKRFSWLVTKVPIRILFITNTKMCSSRNLRRQAPKAAHYRIASLVDVIRRKRINYTRKSINFMANSHLQKWNKTKR